ncbi:unnamed protein product [Parascedosporium putredinis]|uniref:Uncharacterized protein n=1 Tax=Parascedosporium putredinis TaxID=1442378 RepID=A0A9P1HDL0_9PEZI|nr:unnamed protein product [Parascedosporium putredinis]CAI8004381.1 unnamed protein product [Parascedosporium putredinis]
MAGLPENNGEQATADIQDCPSSTRARIHLWTVKAVAEEASQRRIDSYCEDTVIPWTVLRELVVLGPGENGDIEQDEELDLSPKPRS